MDAAAVKIKAMREEVRAIAKQALAEARDRARRKAEAEASAQKLAAEAWAEHNKMLEMKRRKKYEAS